MRDSESRTEATYTYFDVGKTPKGKLIPKAPGLWLRIRSQARSAVSPVLIDTGFDGGIYSDDRLPVIFEDQAAEERETIYALGHSIECQLFKARVSLVDAGGRREIAPIGDVLVHIPIRAEDLSESLLIGREILNKLDLLLQDASKVSVSKAR